jgi:alcohol dehydrogenase class IV
LIAKALGCQVAGLGPAELRTRLIQRVLDLRAACGIAAGLGARGVRASDAGRLAAKAIGDPCNATNPRPPSRTDLEAIYLEAL